MKNGVKKRFSDEDILQALIEHGSARAAAKALGCSTGTITARLTDEGFRKRYDDVKGAVLSDAVDTMRSKLSTAVDTLTGVMEDDSNPATVRVSAADALLRHSLRYIETQDFEKRLKALEERYASD